jgi:nucleoside-diphosphate-sugar epimerase
VATAFVRAAAAECPDKRIFNIGSSQGHSLLDVIDEIEGAFGRELERKFLSARSSDVPINVLSIERAERLLGWKPQITFAEGIARTIGALRG